MNTGPKPRRGAVTTAGQDRQIVEAAAATLAAVAPGVLLGVADPVAYDGATAIGPTVLRDQLVALRVVDEEGEINQFRRVQDDTDWARNFPNRINCFAS
jgi:hypothetical protein